MNFLEVVRAQVVPWHFWYYPFGTGADAMGSMTGPLAKFDAHFSLGTATRDFEVANHGRGSRVDWGGHCEAATVASILFQQPTATGIFSEDDMEALVTELCWTHVVNNKFVLLPWGQSPYGDLESLMVRTGADTEQRVKESPFAEPGIPEGNDFQSVVNRLADLKVGAFHATLQELISDRNTPLFADLRVKDGGDSHSRWHQAVYKYITKYSQRLGGSLGPRDLQLETVFYSNGDYDRGSNGGNPDTRVPRRGRGIYLLSVGTDGEVLTNKADNDWVSLKNPDSMKPGTAEPTDVAVPRILGEVAPLPATLLVGHNPAITESRLRALGLRRNE